MYEQLVKRIRETIEHLELARINAYKDLVYNESYNIEETGIRVSDRLPKCKVKSFQVNGYPVFQFAYEGMLPMYDKDKKYNSEIRDYYIQATNIATHPKKVEGEFGRATLLIVHYFGDFIARDLDNRNRKHLIDAIKMSGIIKNDDWKHIETMEVGMKDPDGKFHLQVYVLDSDNFADFYNYFKKNHLEMRDYPDEKIQNIAKKDVRTEGVFMGSSSYNGSSDNQKDEDDEFWG